MKAMLFILALLAFFAGAFYYVATKPRTSYSEERRTRIETDIEQYLKENEGGDNHDKAKAILRLVDQD